MQIIKLGHKINIKYLAQYPSSFFYDLSDATRYELAKEAIKQKNYHGLEHLLKHIDNFSELISDAVDFMDVEAVKVICKFEGAHRDIRDISLIDLFNQNLNLFKFSYDESGKTGCKIFKLLAEIKPNMCVEDLQAFSHIVGEWEFYKFCELKGIILSDPLYANLDLSHFYWDFSYYSKKEQAPLHKIWKNEYCPDKIDLILSRTHTEMISKENMREIYKTIYNLNSISKQMMSYLAMQIAKGDSIKIIIDEVLTSCYKPNHNKIEIDIKFLKSNIFNIESVIIHEVGHYFYNHLFKNSSLPIERSILERIVRYNEKLSQKEALDNLILNPENNNPFRKGMKLLQQYEEAAKIPIYKAAELLDISPEPMEHYLLSADYCGYFKQHSIIDLFYLNGIAGICNDPALMPYLPYVSSKSLLDIYFEYFASEGTCYITGNLFHQEEKTIEEIYKWAMEFYLPQMVKKLGLSSTEIYFLERIGDYINRGTSQYSKLKYNYGFEKYVELIVRYAELEAVGVEQDLIDSFSGLVEFHHKYATPKAEAELSDYHLYCESFSNNTSTTPSGYEELIV